MEVRIMKKRSLVALCVAALTMGVLASTVSAHGIFFANRLDQKALVLGEGPTDNAYKPSNVTQMDAYDVNFMPTKVDVVEYSDHIAVKPGKDLGVTATFFDYGYFTKDKAGVMHQAPFDQVKDAVKTTHAVKYNVNYWNENVKPAFIYNVPIQIVPSVNPMTLKKGDTFDIRVYKDGKPMANAPLIQDVLNDLTNESKTDAEGRATVTVSANGLNVIGVEIGYPTGDGHTQTKYFSSLSFIINPE